MSINLFTFHNVSINTSIFLDLITKTSSFTFHNVSINTAITIQKT